MNQVKRIRIELSPQVLSRIASQARAVYSSVAKPSDVTPDLYNIYCILIATGIELNIDIVYKERQAYEQVED